MCGGNLRAILYSPRVVKQGSHEECLVKLMSFGIPVNRFPYGEDLQIKPRPHGRWISRQKILDKMILNGTFDRWEGAQIPGMKDILIGTGAYIPGHAGNIWLISILEEYLEEYNGAISEGKHKIEIIKKVLLDVEEKGARFLKQSPDHIWCRVDNPVEKREKIIHAFRGINKKSNQKKLTAQKKSVTSGAPTDCLPDSKRARIETNK